MYHYKIFVILEDAIFQKYKQEKPRPWRSWVCGVGAKRLTV